MKARRLFVIGFAAALLTALGCSNDDGGGGTTPAALGCADGGAPAADGVTLMCGGATDSTTEQVDVVMGGTTPGTTLRGLNFDVRYDPLLLEFMPAATYTSPLFPNALIAVTLFNGLPGQVVVSIQQPGTDPGVVVPTGPQSVLSLSFRSVAGAVYGPTQLLFVNTDATSASAPISFSSSLVLSYQ
jgi:hypothetical protein